MSLLLLGFAPVVLAWSPQVGDKAVYRYVGTARTSGMTLPIEGTIAETVIQVETGRVVETQDRKLAVQMPGGPRTSLPFMSETITYRADGKLIDLSAESHEEDSFRTERLKELVLLGHPVAVGEAWTFERPSDPNASDTGLKLTFTLVGEERVGAKDAWKIASRGGETGGSKASVEATFWIDKATGARLHCYTKIAGAAFPGDGGRTVDIEEDLLRQPS